MKEPQEEACLRTELLCSINVWIQRGVAANYLLGQDLRLMLFVERSTNLKKQKKTNNYKTGLEGIEGIRVSSLMFVGAADSESGAAKRTLNLS